MVLGITFRRSHDLFTIDPSSITTSTTSKNALDIEEMCLVIEKNLYIEGLADHKIGQGRGQLSATLQTSRAPWTCLLRNISKAFVALSNVVSPSTVMNSLGSTIPLANNVGMISD